MSFSASLFRLLEEPSPKTFVWQRQASQGPSSTAAISLIPARTCNISSYLTWKCRVQSALRPPPCSSLVKVLKDIRRISKFKSFRWHRACVGSVDAVPDYGEKIQARAVGAAVGTPK
jgi:hypothetical protein